MRVLLAMLGASEFPRRLDLSSPVFARSHTALRDWLLDNVHGPMVAGEDCLDLFDSPRSWPDQEAELADWLVDRAATQPLPTDLIVHYVGHGGFRDESRDYYLAIRTTRADNPFYSSIMVDSLWRALRGGARRLRRFLIIDACFAAAAARAMMAPLQEAVKVKVCDLQDAEGAQAMRDGLVVPDRGTAVLCSSSAQDSASMAGAGGLTQFTDGLMQVLGAGSEVANDRLSLAQVHALVKAFVSARYKESAVAPELHAPDQRLGLPQDVPIFPNVRLSLARRTKRYTLVPDGAATDPESRIEKYNSDLEAVPFADWNVFFAPQPPGQTKTQKAGKSVIDGRSSYSLETSSRLPMGTNKYIEMQSGIITFDYKVLQSTGNNIIFFLIPMRYGDQLRPGKRQHGDEIRHPSYAREDNPFRVSLRLGENNDLEWHSAELLFDFSRFGPNVFAVFAPRINEGQGSVGAGHIAFTRVRVFARA